MKVLGLIPARGGSVRLPGKNMLELVDRPLIGWTINAAIEAGSVLDRIAVSTDDDAALSYAATSSGPVYPLRRPAALSRGDQPMQLSVVRDALIRIQSLDLSAVFDAVCLLQPTSPLRTAEDIIRAVTIMRDNGADSVVSVTDTEDDYSAFQIRHAGRLEAVPQVVVPNGAIFLATTKHLDAGGHWFNGHCYAYRMPKDRSLDIDTLQDLEFARLAMREHAARL